MRVIKVNISEGKVFLTTKSESELYFLWEKLDIKNLYTETWGFILEEGVEVNRICNAIKCVFKNNQTLQMIFFINNGKVNKRIKHKEPVIQIKEINQIDDYIEYLKGYSFNLNIEPLINFHILSEIKTNKKYLIINSHHIVSDGWTKNLLLSEIMDYYYNENLKKENFIIYSQKDDKNKTFSNKIEEFELYYKKNIELPSRVNKYAAYQSKHSGFGLSFQFEKETIEKINRFCLNNRITVFPFYLGSFYSFICKYSNNKKMKLGIPFVNRESTDQQKIMGYFVNTLPFSIETEFDWRHIKNDEYYRIIQRQVFKLSEFQSISMTDVLKKSNLRGVKDFNTVFSYQESQNFKGIKEELNITQRGAKFELTGNIKKLGNKLFCELEFSDEIWTFEEADYFTNMFKIWIEKCTSMEISEIINEPLLSKKQYLLVGCKKDLTEFTNIYDKFEAVSHIRGNAPAIIEDDECISYSSMIDKIQFFSNMLSNLSITKGQVVALLLKRSVSSIALVLALAKKGITHIHLSKYYPEERMKYILKDSNTNILITDKDSRDSIPKEIKIPVYIKEELLDKKIASNIEKIEHDYSGPFELIYTSGTTGNSRGVMITHKNILNLALNFKELGFSENDLFSQASSFTFDAWFFEVWVPLLNGAGVCIIKDPISDSVNWNFLNYKYKPNIYFFTTALFNSFVENKTISILSNVDKIFIGGEVASPKYINKAQELLNGIDIYNCYGPTENTTITTIYKVNYENNTSIPLGTPLANISVGILGKNNQLLPRNCLGEIVVSGKSLMESYYGQINLTDEKCIIQKIDGIYTKFYKTGDIGKIGKDDNLYYSFRKDRQVKIRGFRVELTEIENKLLQIDGVHKCIVIFTKDTLKRKLIFYYEGSCSEKKIRSEAIKLLPSYMIPNEIVQVEEIKLTVNGKIDKNALKVLNVNRKVDLQAINLTNTEIKTQNCIKEVLGVDEIGYTENFYEIGIDSIVSMQICANLQSMGLNVSVSELLRYQSIRDLAQYLEEKCVESEAKYPQGVWEENELTPIQKWFFETQTENLSHWNQSITLKVDQGIGLDKIKNALVEMIETFKIFKSGFKKINGQWKQIINNCEKKYHIAFFEKFSGEEVEDLIASQQKSLDIENRMYMFTIIKHGPQIIIHLVIQHLIIDGVSWRHLLKKLSASLIKNKTSIQVITEVKTFDQWGEYLRNYDVQQRMRDFWSSYEVKNKTKVSGKVQDIREKTYIFSKEVTKRFKEVIQTKFFSNIEATLLAIASHSLEFKLGGNSIVQMEGHGRPINEAGFASTIGWFTTIYPLKISNQELLSYSIIKLHNQLESIPNKGIDYALINTLNFLSDWTFNYLGEFDSNTYKGFEIVSLFRSDDFGKETNAIYTLAMIPIIIDERLEIRVSYNFNEYSADDVENILNNFIYFVEEILEQEHPIYLPVTSLQKGMILENEKNKGVGNYVIQWNTQLTNLDISLLQSSISKLIKSCDTLRSTFLIVDDVAVQVIRSYEEILLNTVISFMDWSELLLDDLDRKLDEFLKVNRKKVFNIYKGPLFRFTVIKTKDFYILVFENHHLILDGWSMSHLFNRLSYFYENNTSSFQIIDRNSILKRKIENEKKYLELNEWESVVKNYDSIKLFDYTQKDTKGNLVVKKTISSLEKIYECLRKNKFTMNQFFLLAWSITLSHLFGKDDILFGVTVSGRNSFKKEEIETIGMFISTLPFRVKKAITAESVTELYDQIRENSYRVQSYNSISWLDIAEYFNINPEMKIGYVFENYPISSDGKIFSMNKFTVKEQIEFPLALCVAETTNCITYEVNYSSVFINEEMLNSILLLMEHTIEILENGENDNQKIVETLRKTPDVFLQSKSLQHSKKDFSTEIINYLNKYSKYMFIKTESKVITYGEVFNITNRLIHKTKLSNNDTVAVLTEDRLKKTIYALACFISGATYVPLSKEFNQNRIDYILKDSKANCLFTEEGDFRRVKNLECVSSDKEGIAYIIYTSGTTGEPKGVIITQINIQNAIESNIRRGILDRTDIVYQNISMTFDPSIMDILLPLYIGATIYIPQNRLYGEEMETVIKNQKITVIAMTASLARILKLDNITTLKKIMIGGEVLRFSDIKHIPENILIYNLYGPTESTIITSTFEVNGDIRSKYKIYPIGLPLDQINCNIYSQYGFPLPFGMTGELMVEGPLVSGGYTDSQLNKNVFEHDKFRVEKNKYYTGDMCCITRDKLIYFNGRKDRQVKLRGYRIELNEIEQSIKEVSGISNFQLQVNEEKTMIMLAYIGKISEEQVKKSLSELLPSYMIPSIINKFDEFPINANGKIDNKILFKKLKRNLAQKTEAKCIDSEEFKEIIGVFKEVLEISDIYKEDNFFAIGGNSLTAIKAVRKINQNTNYNTTIQELFGAKNFGVFVKKLCQGE